MPSTNKQSMPNKALQLPQNRCAVLRQLSLGVMPLENLRVEQR